MWWISVALGLQLTVRHWPAYAGDMPFARHVVRGLVKVIIAPGLYAVVLLPLCYLGTWVWCSLRRTTPPASAATSTGSSRDEIPFRKALLYLIATLVAMLLASALLVAVAARMPRALTGI